MWHLKIFLLILQNTGAGPIMDTILILNNRNCDWSWFQSKQTAFVCRVRCVSIPRRSDDSPSDSRILQEIIACVGRIANAWHHNCFWRKFGPDRPVRFKWENSNLQKKIVRSTAGSFWGYFWWSLIMMNFKPRPNRDSYSEAAEHGDCRQCGNNRAGHPGSVNKGWDIFSYLSLSLDLSLCQ